MFTQHLLVSYYLNYILIHAVHVAILYKIYLTFHSLQKLESRKSALEKATGLSEEKKDKWRKVLVHSFIASEESGTEIGENNVPRSVLKVKDCLGDLHK